MTTENATSETQKLTRKDFLSSTDPRWCAGCGDYATLNILTRVLAESGIARENFAIISGIGCSSRLPYYINAYGFHTIHGRAPTVAMGLKMVNPKLCVWIATGDGDAMSIGGNHFLHMIRRNPDIKLLLFNNQIYGLTKGQTSPTSPLGTITKSSPQGSLDRPMHPLTVALGSGASFVARTTDTDVDLMHKVLTAAQNHKGAAIVEVLLNCVIFNNGVFDPLTNKDTRQDTTLKLQTGEPLIFGKNQDKGIRMNGLSPEVVQLGPNGEGRENLIIHDPNKTQSHYAYMLAEMMGPDMPVPLGVFKQVNEYVYEPRSRAFNSQKNEESFNKLLRGSSAWVKDSTGAVSSLER